VIYTELFKWADGDLFKFLWRFNYLSAIDRGHDATVSSAEGISLRSSFWDDRAPNEEPMRYITPSAKWATEALIGWATFGYIAYDFESGNLD